MRSGPRCVDPCGPLRGIRQAESVAKWTNASVLFDLRFPAVAYLRNFALQSWHPCSNSGSDECWVSQYSTYLAVGRFSTKYRRRSSTTVCLCPSHSCRRPQPAWCSRAALMLASRSSPTNGTVSQMLSLELTDKTARLHTFFWNSFPSKARAARMASGVSRGWSARATRKFLSCRCGLNGSTGH